MYSPTWGFALNLPEGYEYVDGDGRDRFSFNGPGMAHFDIVVYSGVYGSIKELVDDVNRRLSNQGNSDFFKYKDRQAAILGLSFNSFSGWALCVELDSPAGTAAGTAVGTTPPFLLALAYDQDGSDALSLFHMSALDSIIPSSEERFFPGPIMEYSYPRGEPKQAALFSSGVSAMIRENDAQAAQDLIEREFNILKNYLTAPNWKEAWIRYYRMIYRDSFDRVSPAAVALGQRWDGDKVANHDTARIFAQKALAFVQGFKYERDLNGSDFINLVTAVTEGRGDCDSRAMLWAIISAHAGIRTAMMVSREYNHAMGLADIDGTGARFDAYETRWLVAETTDNVDIGLIAQDVSDARLWLGILLE